MLIGNKKDKENREVPFNMALEYAVRNNFGLMEVSARQGLGIQEAFNLLVSQIYTSIVNEAGEEADSPNAIASAEPDMTNVRQSILNRTKATSDSVVLDPSKHVDGLDQSYRRGRRTSSL